VIDESDLQLEEHDQSKIVTEEGIVIFAELEKLRINLCERISVKKAVIMSKIVFLAPIQIEPIFTSSNADPSINCALRGIIID
jgi:hypothetical protein